MQGEEHQANTFKNPSSSAQTGVSHKSDVKQNMKQFVSGSTLTVLPVWSMIKFKNKVPGVSRISKPFFLKNWTTLLRFLIFLKTKVLLNKLNWSMNWPRYAELARYPYCIEHTKRRVKLNIKQHTLNRFCSAASKKRAFSGQQKHVIRLRRAA